MTQLRDPINITLLRPRQYITRQGLLPVTSHQIYEPSTTIFHPEGLFSEVIFGQVGSTERLIRNGYIDLRTKVFQPLVYKIIVSLKALYGDVLAGKVFAKYDKDIKELVRCEMTDIGSGTGFTFFMKHFPNIDFKQTDSLKRKDKLSILEKYKDNLLIDKYIVIAAGIRDLREENGRLSSEDINKLYLGLLSLTQAIPENLGDDSAIFDALRYNIQIRTVQIYEYLENLVTGKRGFALGKFSARNVALGNRNVITSPPISRVLSPTDPRYFKADETLIPVFQMAKACTPAVVYELNNVFFKAVFDNQSVNFSLIDPKTFELGYVKVNEQDRNTYTTTDGITKLINLFRNESIRHLPVAIRDEENKFHYLYLVYDLGDTVYFLRNKEDFAAIMSGKSKWGIGDSKMQIDTSRWTTTRLSHLSLFEKYGIAKDEVVISGSGSLCAHGYEGTNNDLDIIVSPATLERLVKDPGFIEKEDKSGYRDPTGIMEISTKHMELSSSYDGVYDFKIPEKIYDQLKATADNIDGYYFVNLDILRSVYTRIYEHSKNPKYEPKVKWLNNFFANAYGNLKIQHLELFDRYGIDKSEAVISGSAAMIAHGYDGVNEDLDVTVSKATFDRLIKEFGFYKIESTKNTEVYKDPTGNMEIMYYSPVAQLEHKKLVEIADNIDGYLFDSLSTLQTGYHLSPELRPKDKPKINWLKYKVFDPKYLRPLTYIEMFYIVLYRIVNLKQPPKHVTATRYPILNVFGILPTRVNIQTTEPNRTVTLKHVSEPLNLVLPRYPVFKAACQDSMSPHPSTLELIDGDFDGDTMSILSILSDEANNEIENFFKEPFSMVNSSGQLNSGLSNCKVGKYTFYSMTKEPSEKIYI